MVVSDWSSLVDSIEANCRSRHHFLSRSDERGLKDQAGDDWRSGDEMVDSMNRIAGLARDRALAALRSWSAPAWPLAALPEAAIAMLEALPDARHYYSRLGVACVIAQLRLHAG